MRDLCAPELRPLAHDLDPAKLLKAAAIFSLCNLPDCAAEILITFRDRLAALIDIDTGLDLLTAAAQRDGMPQNHRDYRATFLADAPCFYTPKPDVAIANAQLSAEARSLCVSTTRRLAARLRWLAKIARRI